MKRPAPSARDPTSSRRYANTQGAVNAPRLIVSFDATAGTANATNIAGGVNAAATTGAGDHTRQDSPGD